MNDVVNAVDKRQYMVQFETNLWETKYKNDFVNVMLKSNLGLEPEDKSKPSDTDVAESSNRLLRAGMSSN